MVDDFVATADPAMLARINAVGRVGRPEEVAELVGYLALEAPDYLTGASLLIDGGQTAMAPLLG
jgi:NAD(P)-dependent dehydrogenase (short-subunit alcohol dehydrogenase family)